MISNNMSFSERLFYNKYKFRIRMMLNKGLGLLRHTFKYKDEDHLLEELKQRRHEEKKYTKIFQNWDIWSLDENQERTLLKLFHYRENFDDYGRIRVECPIIDFYTNNLDFYKIAEDLELEPELCVSNTDEPNTIIVKKLPYDNYKLKCITRYTYVDNQIFSALLSYENSGEIKFPWDWTTRRFLINRTSSPLPSYIYAQDYDNVTWINLIAGDVIGTVYSYIIDK
jgi:hypothetical protein